MKLLRKWSYFIILLLCGAGILTVTESWKAVAGPGQEAGARFLAVTEELGELLAGPLGFDVVQVDAGLDGVVYENGNEGEGFIPDSEIPSDGSVTGENAAGGNAAGGSTGGNGDIGMSDHVAGGELTKDSESDIPGETEITYRDPSEVVYTSVEDDYFSDAVFIGDSRTVGMFEYGGLENTSTFYASTGLTIFKLFDAKIVPVPDSKEKITIEQALSERQFGKIYLMVGINEMGRGDLEGFLAQYSEVIARLKELQPGAVIYLQGIIKVTTERSDKGDYISNSGIEERNAGIAALADNVTVYYLDVNPVICDETGGMEPSYTTDGVHLMAQYIPIWKDFLKQHAVVLD